MSHAAGRRPLNYAHMSRCFLRGGLFVSGHGMVPGGLILLRKDRLVPGTLGVTPGPHILYDRWAESVYSGSVFLDSSRALTEAPPEAIINTCLVQLYHAQRRSRAGGSAFSAPGAMGTWLPMCALPCWHTARSCRSDLCGALSGHVFVRLPQWRGALSKNWVC